MPLAVHSPVHRMSEANSLSADSRQVFDVSSTSGSAQFLLAWLARYMKISRRLSVLGGSLAVAIFSSALVAVPASANAGIEPTTSASSAEATYIIQVPEGQADALLDELADLGVAPTQVYDDALSGVAVSLTLDELADVKGAMNGEAVEADRPVELMAVQSPAPWNLSMLDFAARPADNQFAYSDSAGAGARVYVIDSGVSPNAELAARLVAGTSFVSDGRGSADCHGHGTHVAGTIAATTYGVAKKATIVPIRVFDCAGGGASISKIVAGINWAINDKPAGTVGIINMSLGTTCRLSLPCLSSDSLLVAVQNAIDAGFVVVAAAGNSNTSACRFTPAAAPNALTVGAVDRNDAEAQFSNYGSCVDLLAPGVDIVSLNFAANGSTKTMSGTSMAAPHVAGAAALYLSANPGASASDVTTAVKANVVPNLAVPYPTHSGTTRGVLNLASLTPAGNTRTPPLAPTGLVATTTGLNAVNLAWQPSLSSSVLTNYEVSFRAVGASAWSTASKPISTATSLTVNGLIANRSYEFRVSGVTDVAGPASSSVRATTWSGLPGPVSSVTTSSVRATSAVLSWTVATANGSLVTDYDLQYRATGTTAWTTVTDGISSVTSATVGGLSPIRGYQFRVRAQSPHGFGPWSSITSVSTLSGIPSAVTTPSARGASPTAVSLTWAAPADNGSEIIDYVIEYKRSNAPTWSSFGDGVSRSPAATVSGLTPGATFNFRVSAKTSLGAGGFSSPVTVTTLTGTPNRIASLTIAPTSTTFNVTWPAPTTNGAAITDYLIDYRLSTSSKWVRFADPVSTTAGVTVSGLTPGATYYVRVTPISSYGSGAAASSPARTLP